MAIMKALSVIIEDIEDLFPRSEISVDLDREDAIVITIKTGPQQEN